MYLFIIYIGINLLRLFQQSDQRIMMYDIDILQCYNDHVKEIKNLTADPSISIDRILKSVETLLTQLRPSYLQTVNNSSTTVTLTQQFMEDIDYLLDKHNSK